MPAQGYGSSGYGGGSYGGEQAPVNARCSAVLAAFWVGVSGSALLGMDRAHGSCHEHVSLPRSCQRGCHDVPPQGSKDSSAVRPEQRALLRRAPGQAPTLLTQATGGTAHGTGAYPPRRSAPWPGSCRRSSHLEATAPGRTLPAA